MKGAAGEMTSDGTGAGTTQYTWNAEGRTATVTPWGGTATTYVYDGDGHRVEDTLGSILFWYGAGDKLVGTTSGGPVNRQWIRFDGRRIATFNMTPTGPWGAGILTDALGSLRVDTYGAWIPKCHADYSPFGEPVGPACTAYDNIQFAKLFMDGTYEDSGDTATHRRYSDTYYRWFSPDPGGMKVVSLANPQTWNMYAYVTDNPTTLNDPSGLGCGPNDKSQSNCVVAVAVPDISRKQSANDQSKVGKAQQQKMYTVTYKTGTTHVSGGDVIITTTTVTATFNKANNKFIGATTETTSERVSSDAFGRNVVSDQTDSGPQAMTTGQFTNFLNNQDEAVDPGQAVWFARATGQDIAAHPGMYAAHVVGLAAGPVLGLPVEVEGLITAVHALHTAADLLK